MVRIVDGRRVTVYRSGLFELHGLTTCVCICLGQEAKLLGARAEARLTRASGSGKARRRRCGRERGVEEQQGRRMKHEDREGEMGICDMHTANTLSHACTRSLCVTPRKCACDKSACVHPPSNTTVVAPTCVRNPEFRTPQTSSFHVHLDISHQDLFHQFAFHHLSDVRVNSSRVPEACSFSDSR